MRPITSRNAPPSGESVPRPAAQATRDSILRAAITVFAKHGFSGGSVEKISMAARSHDRMIYYYFGNKEGLFVAVLEEIYRRFNESESALDLDLDNPVESLAAVIRFMFAYYEKHPEFISLLNTENLHRGRHIGKSLRAREQSRPAIGVIDNLLRSGSSKGLFRRDVSARDLYLLIAAAGYFHKSNRFTLSSFLGEELGAPAARANWESFVTDMVLRGISENRSSAASVSRSPIAPASARQAHASID